MTAVRTPAAGTPEFQPADVEARRTIRESLDETLFVEASAGTGKTTSLVGRVVNLVATGRTTLDRLAAITFTEAAAAELRDRIRQELERAASDGGRSDEERLRCREGAADLDQAAVRTLHAFAATLLHERPLEAGLPPAFETTDEIAAGIRFNEKWNEWLDQVLGQGSPLAFPLSVALSLGMTTAHLKEVAVEFHRNYTDLEGAQFQQPDPMPVSAIQKIVEQTGEIQRLCQYSKMGQGDRLYDHVHSKLPALRRLAGAEPGTPASYRLLSRMLNLRTTRGTQKDWEKDAVSGANACAALKGLLKELDDEAHDELALARRASVLPVLEYLRQFVLDYAEERRREGRAEFHDLLVWARDLLRDRADVREYFRNRFSHILIDEAQDTDPIQAEIAMYLAEAVPVGTGTESRPISWHEISPEPGKLFVVGDPKQSIYRFRRADVVQMVQLQQRMEQAGGRRVRLVQNFRSQKDLVDWVNQVFDRWMSEAQGEDASPAYVQAQYEKMHPRWLGDTGGQYRPQVWALSNEASGTRVGPVREQEGEEIASLLHHIVNQGWQVLDEGTTRESGVESYRSARFSDICILMPRRTALRELERGLEAQDIPYRLESASLVFETQEIRDLLNCLKAIDNPADQVAAVAALRSPAFGCSDIDLFRHHQGGGSFHYLSEHSDGPEGPVAEALGVLRSFHEERLSGSTGAFIDRFVRDRMLMEIAIDHPRMREQWRRYRFMVEQAWRFSESGGKSLRAFVEWVNDQIAEGARMAEAPVPESDEDAVRVMTIHAAKGLEFPVVILTGINSGRDGNTGPVQFDRNQGKVEVGLGSQDNRFATGGYEAMVEVEKKMTDAEGVRLMYVAATRARDHLVLSLRRTENAAGGNSPAGHIARLTEDLGNSWAGIDGSQLPRPSEPDEAEEPEQAGPLISHDHSRQALQSWEGERMSLISAMGRPSSAAATALGRTALVEPEDKPEQQTDEPWRRGRGGTQVGRAVHGVLQSIELETGEGLDERARAQASAEGIPGREAEIVRHCRAAIDSDIVKRAVASGRYWREVAVAVGMGDGSLHGFIDLLFDEGDGLVVADYKTDSIDAADAPEAVKRYRLQGGAYAYAIQQLTGRPVKEVVFLYLQPRREERLPDLPDAMRDARAAAEALLNPQSS